MVTVDHALDSRSLISIANMGITYASGSHRTPALTDLSLEIKRGEVIAVVGPSGSGKTSLLRVLAGLLAPSHGSVRIDGMSPELYRHKSGIGLCFQNPVLLEWLTLWENVTLPAELQHRPADETAVATRELLGLVGLSGFEKSYPAQLSGGMRQRAALVRALLLRPTICLLDEPASGIDEIAREALWVDAFKLWRRYDQTVVLVTHSSREACFLADRVIVLSPRPGRVRSVIEVDLPADRSIATLSSRRFHELCDDVRSVLA